MLKYGLCLAVYLAASISSMFLTSTPIELFSLLGVAIWMPLSALTLVPLVDVMRSFTQDQSEKAGLAFSTASKQMLGATFVTALTCVIFAGLPIQIFIGVLLAVTFGGLADILVFKRMGRFFTCPVKRMAVSNCAATFLGSGIVFFVAFTDWFFAASALTRPVNEVVVGWLAQSTFIWGASIILGTILQKAKGLNRSQVIAFVAVGLLGLAAVFTAKAAQAEPVIWSNSYIDYTSQKGLEGNPLADIKSSNATIGTEGGFIGETINAYGFYEYNQTLDNHFAKASATIGQGFAPYGQISYFTESGFSEQQVSAGVAYVGAKFLSFNVTPFIAVNHTTSDFDNGTARAMAGWSATRSVDGLLLTSWNESRYHLDKGLTANGALGAFLNIDTETYVGVQYRYFYNEAGNTGFGDAVIFRLGYRL